MDNYHQVWDIICVRERSSDSGIKDGLMLSKRGKLDIGDCHLKSLRNASTLPIEGTKVP